MTPQDQEEARLVEFALRESLKNWDGENAIELWRIGAAAAARAKRLARERDCA
jgi:hypothetical protein